jgi:carbonic anhydrase
MDMRCFLAIFNNERGGIPILPLEKNHYRKEAREGKRGLGIFLPTVKMSKRWTLLPLPQGRTPQEDQFLRQDKWAVTAVPPASIQVSAEQQAAMTCKTCSVRIEANAATSLRFKIQFDAVTGEIQLEENLAHHTVFVNNKRFAVQKVSVSLPANHRLDSVKNAVGEVDILCKRTSQGVDEWIGLAVLLVESDDTGTHDARYLDRWTTTGSTKSGSLPLLNILPTGAGLFVYEGSHLTPPCSRVTWMVFNRPARISRRQHRVFAGLLTDKATAAFRSNNRTPPANVNLSELTYVPASVIEIVGRQTTAAAQAAAAGSANPLKCVRVPRTTLRQDGQVLNIDLNAGKSLQEILAAANNEDLPAVKTAPKWVHTGVYYATLATVGGLFCYAVVPPLLNVMKRQSFEV